MENSLILIEILKQIPALVEVDPDDLLDITKKIKLKKFENNEFVFREGDSGETFYVIKSGKVEVLKKSDNIVKQVAVLYPDNFFGEAALLNQAPRNASIRCLENTELYVFNKDDFYDLIYL
ncbi:cyclic nucleotide-binding domain-containing protein [Candidatus Peregrinibacteria bacterium]|nr:cyclic nucleotide-binding domain-containing protein [Candidatus Peregrinibacteria bacterium]